MKSIKLEFLDLTTEKPLDLFVCKSTSEIILEYGDYIFIEKESGPIHSPTCVKTKTGIDDVDCTCGLQEVLDDEAKELAEENQPDDETEKCIEEESND